MEDEKEAQIEGKLVMAVRKCTSIEVFLGPLSQLVNSRAELGLISDQYHFNVKVQRDLMRCVQVPAVVLERISSFSHSDEDREQVRRKNEFLKLTDKLSAEKLDELIGKMERAKHEREDMALE